MAKALTRKAWIHTQPCAVQPCILRAWQHHSTNAPAAQHEKSVGGRRGKSQKAAEEHSFGLCTKHHDNFHYGKGFAADWDKAQRRKWQDEQVALCTERYQAYLDSLPAENLSEEPLQTVSLHPTIEQEAAAFCASYGLGEQIQHDMERLLRKVAREGHFYA